MPRISPRAAVMCKLLCAIAIFALKASAARVEQAMVGPEASEERCAIVRRDPTIPASARQVFFRFLVRQLTGREKLVVEWVDPQGSIAATAPYDHLPAGSVCLLSHLPVGGFDAGRSPGVWTVRVRLNGSIVAASRFAIVADAPPGAPSIAKVDVRELESGGTELTISGRGFNVESLVHLAQYNIGGGWRYIAHLLPTLVSDSLVRVRLDQRLSPAEYVVFVKNGERLSGPGRFLISTGGYRLPIPASEPWYLTQGPYGAYSHWGRSLHAYDIAPRSGSCVVAMRSGIAYTFDLGLGQTPHRRIFGNYITIQHEDGEFSHYAHLKSGTFRVRNGEWVERGQALALAGNSGYSFGTHVHVHVTREFKISSQSIPFQFEDLPLTSRPDSRGPIVSANDSPLGNCSGPRPAASPYQESRLGKQSGRTMPREPNWRASVPVAGWWSEVTNVPRGTEALEVRLEWDQLERDVDLYLVSPSGRRYGPYADRNGYFAAESYERLLIEDPEPGPWRVCVQGIRSTGEPIEFRIYRSLPASRAAAWGDGRRR